MVKTGELVQVEIEGWEEPGLYLPSQQPLIDSARMGELTADYTTLLSPFDPLTWDRNRVRQLFNFDFMIQSYTPKEKRAFGYFPLPILHRGHWLAAWMPKLTASRVFSRSRDCTSKRMCSQLTNLC